MIDLIRKNDIDGALKTNSRQYLAGNLQLPQELKFIFDEDVEFGMTKYTKYTYEKPHYHTDTVEYAYMIEGETKFIDLQDMKEYHFVEGDFYIVRNNTVSAQKSLAGTKIIAAKVPSGNDKVFVDISDKLKIWYQSWESYVY